MNAFGIIILILAGLLMLFEVGSFVYQLVQRKKGKKDNTEVESDNVID